MLECNNHKYDVLCLSEHFLCEAEIEVFHVQNYAVASFFARKQHIHGGSIILCKNDIKYVPKHDLVMLSNEMHCEIAAVEIIQLDFIIITVYRPPNGDYNIFLDTMTLLLENIFNSGKYIIINGDFNIHFNCNNAYKHNFLDTMNSYGFVHRVFENTRLNTCIDNILINFDDILNHDINVFNPSLSDHCAVNIGVDISALHKHKHKTEVIFSRPITTKGKFDLYHLLSNETWPFLNSNLNADEKHHLFLNTILQYRDIAFPLTKKQIQVGRVTKISWFNEELREMRENLRFLNDLYSNFRTVNLADRLKRYKYKYKKAINEAKQRANTKYIQNSDNIAKAAWDIINTNRKHVSSTGRTDIHANDFNNFFTDIADNILADLPDPATAFDEYLGRANTTGQEISFSFREVTFIEVRNAINNLKNKHSKDIYGLNIILIKSLTDLLVVPLTKLFNQSIKEGVYPSCFKIVKLIPVFKKGDQGDLNNYRPIALIPVISKIFELLLKNQLEEYFESNHLLVAEQFGFRKNKSTVLAINKLCETIIEGFEAGEFVGATFCDLSKAFDCVSHEILFKKLEHYGVHPLSLNLLRSYLNNRIQITSYEGSLSEDRINRHGVPQGSILGPLLFLIYMNDITVALPQSAVLYADDTSFTCSSTDYAELKICMEASISRAGDWFAAERLCLNQSKTENIIFSLRTHEEVNNPCSIKFLGIHLDPTLKFDSHVDHIAKKISRNIFVLKNLTNTVAQEVCTLAFHALVQSICSYGILIWGHSPHANRIFSLQRKAMRVLAKLQYRSDAKDSFRHLNIMTLPSKYIFECLLHAKNNNQIYITSQDVHNHDTRRKGDLRIDYLRLKKSWNATLCYAPLFYNKLPESVRSLQYKLFRKVIKTYLTNKAFYKFEEFLNSAVTVSEFKL